MNINGRPYSILKGVGGEGISIFSYDILRGKSSLPLINVEPLNIHKKTSWNLKEVIDVKFIAR